MLSACENEGELFRGGGEGLEGAKGGKEFRVILPGSPMKYSEAYCNQTGVQNKSKRRGLAHSEKKKK